MNQRSVIVVFVVALIAAVVVALWFASKPPEAVVAPRADGADVVVVGTAPVETVAKKKPVRAEGRTRWEPIGHGTVVGVLREYGSDRPLEGVELTLEAGRPGPNELLRTKSRADGGFTFEKVTNFDAWAFRAVAPRPLADTELAGIGVIENRATDLGTVYLAPGFGVPGIVLDEKGDPVAGATIRAIRSRPISNSMDLLRLIRELPVRAPAVDSATSGPDGTFELRKVPPGRYDFTVEKPAFQIRVEGGVVITPDAKLNPLKFVLQRGFTLDGKVVREGEGPVAGIPVVAFRQPQNPLEFNALDKCFATTDEKGAFHIEGLGGGRYVVAVTPEGEPAVADSDVTVPSKKPVEILLKGDSYLEGKVTGDAGKPVEGALVYAISLDAGQPTVGNVKTDGEGHYLLRGLRSGPLQLFLVQAEGYGNHPEDISGLFQGNAKAEVTLQPGRNEKDVSLAKGAVVRGTVKEKGTGAPIAGARVELATMFAVFGGNRGATTAADGTFEITSVAKGAAVLLVSKDGWFQPGVNAQSALMVMMQRSGGGSGAKDTGRGATVVVSEAGEVIERSIELARGSSLSGTVTAPDGTVLAGAQVSLVPESDGNSMMEALGGLLGAPDPRLTDAEGRFEIPGPPPGQNARVVARRTGYLDGKSEIVACGPGDVKAGIGVRMRQGATIQGRVRDEQGRPLEGAAVRWVMLEEGNDWGLQWRVRNASPVVANAKGEFIIQNVETGKLVIQVSEVRHLAFVKRDAVAEDGKTLELDVTLSRGASLAGVVVGADGRPKSGATVRYNRVAQASGADFDVEEAEIDGLQETNGDAVTDAAGSFRAEGLVPGRYAVTGSAEGFAPSETATVAADGSAVTLHLSAGFRISGVVRARGGDPIADVEVTALRRKSSANPAGGQTESTEEAAGVRTGPQGEFELKDLPGGTYDVRVQAGWGQQPRPNVVPVTEKGVQAGRQGLVIEVEQGLTIAGSVFDEDGTPLGEGWVGAQREGPGDPVNAGDQVEEGRFEVAGLQPGKYRLTLYTGGAQRSVVAEAGAKGVRIDLRGGAAVRVLAKKDGASAANAQVWVSNDHGGGSGQTDDAGACEIKGLSEGAYSVTVRWTSGTETWTGGAQAVQVGASGSSDVNVTLEKETPK